MERNRGKNHRYISVWHILLMVLMVVSYLILGQLVLPLITAFERNSDPQPPSYSERTILEVCELLEFERRADAFCSTSSQQNAITLSDALERNYPPNTTSYDDLMYLIGSLPSVSKADSLAGQDFSAGGCPIPNINELECYFIFPGEVGMVSVRFDVQRQVVDYAITNDTGGGTE